MSPTSAALKAAQDPAGTTADATAPALPAINAIGRIALQPTDSLVVLVDRLITQEARASIKRYVQQELLTLAPVLVLDNGMSIGVLSDEPGEPAELTAAVAGSLTPPPIGSLWAAQGGTYAGLARGVNGAPDHHLILAAPSPATDLDWQASMDWAAQLDHGGHNDWSLPTRAESALLFANLRADFAPRWHWTCEQHSASNAWDQFFGDGCQGYNVKGYEGRARAVRRLVIQPFSPSTLG